MVKTTLPRRNISKYVRWRTTGKGCVVATGRIQLQIMTATECIARSRELLKISYDILRSHDDKEIMRLCRKMG